MKTPTLLLNNVMGMKKESKIGEAMEFMREQNRKEIRRILREQNRTKRNKELFLFAYEKSLSVSAACAYAKISRRTYQYWVKQDHEFLEACNNIKRYENAFVEDMLQIKINQRDGPSIRYRLSRRHPEFMRPSKKDMLEFLEYFKENDPDGFRDFFRLN